VAENLSTFRNRRAVSIENALLRVTVLREGGHIAEILDKRTGINPLWIPPWASIEPSTYNSAAHPEYGFGIDAQLLAGIMGHNLCLDLFGVPSAEEASLGLGVHGEASVADYAILRSDARLEASACFPLAQIRFQRTIELCDTTVSIAESIESLASFDRPIAWTQHVTLGPPFLAPGITQFAISATQSKVFESQFGPADYLTPAAEFTWPHAGHHDLSTFNKAPVSSAYTVHLMDPGRDDAFFRAHNPELNLSFGYSWRRTDFPWLGRWEENRSRTHAPWNAGAIACGMEFGVSPFPETRRAMIDRASLFGHPSYRWLPAHGRLNVQYQASFLKEVS
jgi:hypothetical protein